MRLIVVLLGQMTVFPDLPQGQTAEGSLWYRLFQDFAPKKQTGKRQHLFQFLFH